MTHTEKKHPNFGVNDSVYILDSEIYDTPTWIHGIVEGVGEDGISVKRDDLPEPTEYELSDLPDIRFKPQNKNKVRTKKINTSIGIANISTAKRWDYDGNDKETYSLFHQGRFLGEMALTEDQIYELVNSLNKCDIVIDLS